METVTAGRNNTHKDSYKLYDRHLALIAEHKRRITATQLANEPVNGIPVSRYIAYRRLNEARLCARRHVISISFTPVKRRARLIWCRQHCP
ncbi:hypothetical protein TNCV_1164201 [Trichonephila clavipes]|nr:hypothetical protein TNCV_1164201 [Trichonephila clavipes]